MPSRSRTLPDSDPSTSTSRKRKSSYSPTYELPPLIAPSVRDADAQPDPDFLALSKKQRKAIDEAFNDGLQAVLEKEEGSGRGSKRRRVEDNGSGGFDAAPAGGGFDVDDGVAAGGEGSGGFLADDVDMEASAGGGGFFGGDDDIPELPVPPTTKSTHAAPPPRHLLPLSSLPTVMSSLGLSVDDDVLAVFESSGFQSLDSEMTGVERGRGSGGAEGDSWDGQGGIVGYTTLRDFRAVCAAMLEPEEDSDKGNEGDGMEVDAPVEEDGDDSQEEVYEESGDDSPLSELDSEDEDDGEAAYAPNTTKGKAKSKSPATQYTTKPKSKPKSKRPPNPSDDTDLLLPSSKPARPRLSTEQKATVTRLWELMFQGTSASMLAAQTGKYGGSRGERFLGREQVKRWAEVMGENWNDQEVTDMIELFSTQPGRRGLSYDDFSIVLIRGGLL